MISVALLPSKVFDLNSYSDVLLFLIVLVFSIIVLMRARPIYKYSN